MQHFETKTFWHLSLLAPCEFCLITSHCTCLSYGRRDGRGLFRCKWAQDLMFLYEKVVIGRMENKNRLQLFFYASWVIFLHITFNRKKNSGVPDEFYVIFSIHFQIEYSVYILELSLKDIFVREDEFWWSKKKK